MIKEFTYRFEKRRKDKDVSIKVDTKTGEIRYFFRDLDRWFSTKQLFDTDITFDNWKDFVDKDKDAEILPAQGIIMAFMDVEIEENYPELFVNADTSWRNKRREAVENSAPTNDAQRTANPMIVIQANLDAIDKE
jgi:hypothetical protein